MVSKYICSILKVVVLFADGAVRRNTEKKWLLIVPCFCNSPHNSSKRPLLLLWNEIASDQMCFIWFWTYWLVARTRSGLSSVQEEKTDLLSGCDMPSVLESIFFQSISFAILRILRR